MKKEDVLNFIKRQRPLTFREIVSGMKISRSEARALKKTLRGLLDEGELVLTRNGRYGPREDMNLMRGYFEAHREGYGFVILDKPGEKDLFVPAHARAGTMNNDRVIVRVENIRKREGRIIRILDRAHEKVAGRIEMDRASCFLKPKNRSVPFDIYIPPGERAGAKNGDTAIVQITSYPSDKRPPSGSIVKILKKPHDPASEVESIVEEFGLPDRFPKDVSREARLLFEKENIADRRKDLRTLPTVTIDGERAKDFDDAVSIRLTDIGFTLYVHIADVGFYVDWDSPVDLEARKRGTSVYFPDRVIPMLPRELSENLASLIPKEDRRTMTVEMEFDRYGKRFGAKFYPSLIRSDERLTYTSVKKIVVDGDPKERGRYDGIVKELELMAELAGIMRQRRLERGSLDFDLPEPEVLLDMQGRPEAIIRAERNFAHMLIEEFMIAANEAVAEHLEKAGMPCIYRVHERPDPLKLSEIMKSIKDVYKRKAEDIPELLRAAKGSPEEEIINYIILRALKQARYSTINAGHFGLASICYAHFTSPIRRYPDLIVHRMLKESLNKKRINEKRLKHFNELLPEIAFGSSRMERVSDEAERGVLKALRAWFMKDKTGEELEGTIVGITAYGMKIRLNDFYVEGFLHVSSMTDDYYVFSETGFTMRGRRTKRTFKLGEKIRVRVDRVDMDEKEVVFGV
jgi:ribonuclease R